MRISFLSAVLATATFFYGCDETNLQISDETTSSTRKTAVTTPFINLNAGTLKQKVEMIGGDMERSANFLNNASNPDEIVKWCYIDTKFNACRVAIDKKQELVEGKPDLSFYDNAIISMKKIKAANANVKFWATLVTDYSGFGTQNNMPDWIYTGAGYNGGSYDPSKLNVTKYARFICDYLKYMKTNNVPITYMSLCKEWTKVMNASNEQKVIVAIINLLKTSDYTGVVKPKFIGPATYGVGGGNDFLADVQSNSFQSYYEGFSTHQYDNIAYSNLYNFVKTCTAMNKKAYQDESSAGANAATNGVEVDIESLFTAYRNRAEAYQAGMVGELFFEQWSRGKDNETRGIYFKNGTAGTRLRGYYVMKDFTNNVLGLNYIGGGVNNMNDVKIITFKSATKIILYVINSGSVDYDNTEIIVYGGDVIGNTISKKVWSSSSPIEGKNGSDSNLTNNTFKTNIKAKTFSSYVIQI